MAIATAANPHGAENVLRASIRGNAVWLLARLATVDAEAQERHMAVLDKIAALEGVITDAQFDDLREAYLGAVSEASRAIARAWINCEGYSALDAVMDREVWL